MGIRTVRINVDVAAHYEDLGDAADPDARWKVRVTPFGATLYGATMEAAEQRMLRAVTFFMDAFQVHPDPIGEARQYFDRHGVKCEVEVIEESEIPLPSSVGREAIEAGPLNIPMESRLHVRV